MVRGAARCEPCAGWRSRPHIRVRQQRGNTARSASFRRRQAPTCVYSRSVARPSQSHELRGQLSPGELPGEASKVRASPALPRPSPLPREARELIQKLPPLPRAESRVPNPFEREELTGRQSLPSLPPPMLRFARYDVLGRIAVGGMAEIYLGCETVEGGTQRHVAIKVVREQPAKREDAAYFEELFLREGRTASQLTHPSICHVYEFGKWCGHFYIAMEWIDGVSLGALLARLASEQRRLPVTLALTIAAQIAAALDYAHKARDSRRRRLEVVHRDVNPQNIMLRHDGVVKLLDFGVAQAADAHADSRSDTVKGKFGYMAPEQARREALDGRADVFALGVCLFEMLTGNRLYRRETLHDTLKAVLTEPAPSLRAHLPDAPDALEGLVQRALAKDRKKRFQSAGELLAAIESCLGQAGEVGSSRKLGLLMEELYPNARRAAPALSRDDDIVTRLSPVSDAGSGGGAPPAQPTVSAGARQSASDVRDGAPETAGSEVLTGSSRQDAHRAAATPSRAPARVRRLLVASLLLLGALGGVAFGALRSQPAASVVAPPPAPRAAPLVPEPQPAAPAAAPSVTVLEPPVEVRAPEASSPVQSPEPTPAKENRATRRRASPGFVASPGF
jgi:serine/threonine protein kinase